MLRPIAWEVLKPAKALLSETGSRSLPAGLHNDYGPGGHPDGSLVRDAEPGDPAKPHLGPRHTETGKQ